jgi:uncharacterized membrane protein YtjA (UPF0391 family)
MTSTTCSAAPLTGSSSMADTPGREMLYYAAMFFVIALIAAVFGFGGIAAGAAGIAKILFVVFIIGFVVSLVAGLIRRSR